MHRAELIVVLALCGCGRIGFDRSSDADITGVPHCNSVTRVADDFEDGVLDENLWGGSIGSAGISYLEQGGDLVVESPPNTDGGYVGRRTMRLYDLHDARVITEVTQVANAGVVTSFHLEVSGDTYLVISQLDGKLRAAYEVANLRTTLQIIDYSPGDHRFWAIGERDGQVYFETSKDGVTFAPLGSDQAAFDVSRLRITLTTGTDVGVPTPGQARFARLRGEGPPSLACPASSFVDLFEASVIDPLWANSYDNPCCMYAQIGGQLVFMLDGTAGNAALRGGPGLDLRDDQIAVTLTRAPVAGGTASLVARADESNVVEIAVTGGMTNARYEQAGVGSNMMEPRIAMERHLRIREAAGTIYWEVSSDKVSWRMLRSLAAPIAVDDVIVVMRSSSSVSDLMRFDDLNAP